MTQPPRTVPIICAQSADSEWRAVALRVIGWRGPNGEYAWLCSLCGKLVRVVW